MQFKEENNLLVKYLNRDIITVFQIDNAQYNKYIISLSRKIIENIINMLYTSYTWKFKTFVKSSGNNAIEEWLLLLPPSARAAIDTIIRYLEVTERWDNPHYFEKLSGYKALYEIKAKDIVGKIQYRIFGCYGPSDNEFTLLIGATHKGKVYNPPNCFETAEKRYKFLSRNKESVDDYK